jgi:hypothetical protein
MFTQLKKCKTLHTIHQRFKNFNRLKMYSKKTVQRGKKIS